MTIQTAETNPIERMPGRRHAGTGARFRVATRDREFGAKLGLALKLLNISRGRLSAEIRVDKSLVSKWLLGLVVPGGHNLAAVTDLIRSHRARFSQLNWSLPFDAFADILVSTPDGQAPNPVPIAPAAPPWLVPTGQRSATEVAREGDAYPGIYVGFRQSLRNNGEIAPEVMVIWREHDQLFFEQTGAEFTHRGEIVVLRHQLFFSGAECPHPDGLSQSIYPGVSGSRAWRLHGLTLTMHGDRFGTPSAAPVVLQRIADLARCSPRPVASLSFVLSILDGAVKERRLDGMIAPEVLAAIRPAVGVPRPDGGVDHLMTIPAAGAMGRTERDWSAALEHDIRRMRRWLFAGRPDDDPEFPLRMETRPPE